MRVVGHFASAMALAGLAFSAPVQAQTAIEQGQAAFDQGDYLTASTKMLEACGSGDPRGCTMLGMMYELGAGVQKDTENAATLFTMGCEQGDMEGCAIMGARYGGASQHDQAQPFFTQACDRGHHRACYELAPYYLLGIGGVEQDTAISFSMYERGCNGDFGASCTGLASYYRDGIGVSANEATANALLDKACALNDPEGCVELGHLLVKSENIDERVKALGSFINACIEGRKEGCDAADAMETGKL